MKKRATRGITLIWSVLILPILIGFLGLAIDVGYMVWVAQQLQIAADAGALAAVQEIRESTTTAWEAAETTTFANFAAGAPIILEEWDSEVNPDNGDFVIGRFDRASRVFTAQTENINAVKVVARRTAGHTNGPLDLLFGPALGINTTNMEREAIAIFAGGTGAGLIALNETERHSFHIKGSSTLVVDGGNIQVNSSHTDAAYFQANGFDIDIIYNPDASDAAEMNVVGSYRTTGNPSLPTVNVDAPLLEDPLKDIEIDDYVNVSYYKANYNFGTFSVTGGTHTLQPGYYPGGININGGNVILNPGIYILGGVGLRVLGNANFTANGVMLYIEDPGSLYLSGTGIIDIKPINEDTPTIFQARGNTNKSTITGNGTIDIGGTLYFPNALLEVSGDSVTVGSQLIVDKILIDGNGTVTINYDGRNPAIGSRPFLVA